MEVARADATAPEARPGPRRTLAQLLFPTSPEAVESRLPPRHALVAGQDVLVLAPPSEIRFPVAPGARRLRGRFGLLSDDPRRTRIGSATFRVTLHAPGRDETTLYERSLDPLRSVGDRGLQPLDLRFDVEATAELLLRADPGPRAGSATDSTAWAALLVE
jgi:hypothetical protein